MYIFYCTFAFAKGEGTTAAEFLKIGVGARACAMGEAFTAVADDATSCYWNPAGLAQLERVDLVAMHNWWFVGIKQEHLSFAFPFLGNAIGISATYVDFGKEDKTDVDGKLVGEFNSKSTLIGISYACNFFKKIFFGITAKGLQDSIDESTKKIYTGDVGILIKPFNLISFGAIAQNIGNVKIDADPLPYNVKVGVAIRFASFTLSGDIDELNKRDKTEKLKYSTGIEWWLKEVVAFRGGYKSNHDIGKGLTYGFGLNLKLVQFDGAYITYGDLGDTYRASIRIKF